MVDISILEGTMAKTTYLSGRRILQLRSIFKNLRESKHNKKQAIMVVSDHNQPAQCSEITLFRCKLKAFDVRTTEMERS